MAASVASSMLPTSKEKLKPLPVSAVAAVGLALLVGHGYMVANHGYTRTPSTLELQEPDWFEALEVGAPGGIDAAATLSCADDAIDSSDPIEDETVSSRGISSGASMAKESAVLAGNDELAALAKHALHSHSPATRGTVADERISAVLAAVFMLGLAACHVAYEETKTEEGEAGAQECVAKPAWNISLPSRSFSQIAAGFIVCVLATLALLALAASTAELPLRSMPATALTPVSHAPQQYAVVQAALEELEALSLAGNGKSVLWRPALSAPLGDESVAIVLGACAMLGVAANSFDVSELAQSDEKCKSEAKVPASTQTRNIMPSFALLALMLVMLATAASFFSGNSSTGYVSSPGNSVLWRPALSAPLGDESVTIVLAACAMLGVAANSFDVSELAQSDEKRKSEGTGPASTQTRNIIPSFAVLALMLVMLATAASFFFGNISTGYVSSPTKSTQPIQDVSLDEQEEVMAPSLASSHWAACSAKWILRSVTASDNIVGAAIAACAMFGIVAMCLDVHEFADSDEQPVLTSRKRHAEQSTRATAASMRIGGLSSLLRGVACAAPAFVLALLYCRITTISTEHPFGTLADDRISAVLAAVFMLGLAAWHVAYEETNFEEGGVGAQK